MASDHLVVIGSCRKMKELPSESVQLIITSPPCLNAKSQGAGDIRYLNAFCDHLRELRAVFDECYRVLQSGRLICVNFHHFLAPGEKNPVPAHVIHALRRAGFEFQEDMVWIKPKENGSDEEQLRIGALLKNLYSESDDGIFERTLIFSKGKPGQTSQAKRRTRMDMEEAMAWWNTALWDVFTDSSDPYSTLCSAGRFSQQLVQMLISDFSVEGETILDPFLGSGAIAKAAAQLNRRSVGYESNPHYLRIIRQQTGIPEDHLKVVFQREGRLT